MPRANIDPPRLYLPSWQQLQSGLWAPTTVSQDAVPAAPLPAEVAKLLPPQQFVPVGGRASALDRVAVKATEVELGLDPLELRRLVEIASVLPFESAMLAICRIAGVLWHTPIEGAAQLEVARQFFGGVPIVDRFEAFVRTDPRNVLFSEQQMFLVQRLLIEHASKGVLGEPLGNDQAALLGRLIVGAGTIADAAPESLLQGKGDDLLAFFIRNGAFYERPNLLSLFSRSYELFVEFGDRRSSEPDVPIADWIAERYPLTLEEQFAVGFALFAASKAADDEARPEERSLVTLEDAFSSTSFNGRESEILAMIAATRDAFTASFDSISGRDVHQVAWDVTPFFQHPFIVLGDAVALLSPRALMTWLGDGPYYRLLDIASSKTTKRSNQLERYTSFVGGLLERWALGLVRTAYPEPRPAGGGRVWGEQPYGKGGGKRTPDVLIDLGEDLVAIEVRAGYLRRVARVSVNTAEVMRDLDRLVFRKVNQLGERLQDILHGAARIPDVDPAMVHRIWPILVTANLTQPELLHDAITERLPASMGDARVQKLVLMDPEDLEVLMALVEEGQSITDVLGRRQETEYVRLEFLRWVLEGPGLGVPREHSSYARERWDRYSGRVTEILGLTAAEADSAGSG